MLQEDFYFTTGKMYSNYAHSFPGLPKSATSRFFLCHKGSFRRIFSGPVKDHPYVRQSPGAGDTQGEVPYLALPRYISS